MSTDHHFTIGKQLAQMLGSLWAQTKLGLEVGLDTKTLQADAQGIADTAGVFGDGEYPFCDWNGRLSRHGLGSLDVGGGVKWD
jgi:hypothetical protein